MRPVFIPALCADLRCSASLHAFQSAATILKERVEGLEIASATEDDKFFVGEGAVHSADKGFEEAGTPGAVVGGEGDVGVDAVYDQAIHAILRASETGSSHAKCATRSTHDQ